MGKKLSRLFFSSLSLFFWKTSNDDAAGKVMQVVCTWLRKMSFLHRLWRHSCWCTVIPWLCIQEVHHYLQHRQRVRRLHFSRIRNILHLWSHLFSQHRTSSNRRVGPVVGSEEIFRRQGRTWAFRNLLGGDISNRKVVLRRLIRKQGWGLCTRCGMLVLCRQYHILGRHLFRNA